MILNLFKKKKNLNDTVLQFIKANDNIKKITNYHSEYRQNIKKYLIFSLITYKKNININDTIHLRFNLEREIIEVQIDKIKDNLLEITYLSNYPLNVKFYKSIPNTSNISLSNDVSLWEKILIESEDICIVSIDNKFGIYEYIPEYLRVSDSDFNKSIFLIDNKFDRYIINEYKKINNNYYIVWVLDSDNNREINKERLKFLAKLTDSDSNYDLSNIFVRLEAYRSKIEI